jgi:hypothetical protein
MRRAMKNRLRTYKNERKIASRSELCLVILTTDSTRSANDER